MSFTSNLMLFLLRWKTVGYFRQIIITIALIMLYHITKAHELLLNKYGY